MQVRIGTKAADVSDDGRDIQFTAPAATGRVLALPFHDKSPGSTPESASSTVASTITADVPAVAANLDGRAGAGLVCAVVAAIAVKRFIGRTTTGRGEVSRPLSEELDDAAFLKRYARPK